MKKIIFDLYDHFRTLELTLDCRKEWTKCQKNELKMSQISWHSNDVKVAISDLTKRW